MYNYGKSHIKKHAYGVYVRLHPTDAGIEKYYYPIRASESLTYETDTLKPLVDDSYSASQQLYSMAAVGKERYSMAGITSLSTASSASLTDENYWYKISEDSIETIHLTPLHDLGIGIENDVLVIECGNGASDISIEDESAVDRDITLTSGDIAAFRCNANASWIFWYKAGASTNIDEGVYDTNTKGYIKLGAMEENPNIITSDGDSINLSDASILAISENVEVSGNVLEVTKDNWEYLRNNLQNKDVDVIFSDYDNENWIIAENIRLKAEAEYTGNDINKIIVTANGEDSDITSLVTLQTT